MVAKIELHQDMPARGHLKVSTRACHARVTPRPWAWLCILLNLTPSSRA